MFEVRRNIDHGAFRVDMELDFSDLSIEDFNGSSKATFERDVGASLGVEPERVLVRSAVAGSVIVAASVVGFADKAGVDRAVASMKAKAPTDSFGPCAVLSCTAQAVSVGGASHQVEESPVATAHSTAELGAEDIQQVRGALKSMGNMVLTERATLEVRSPYRVCCRSGCLYILYVQQRSPSKTSRQRSHAITRCQLLAYHSLPTTHY